MFVSFFGILTTVEIIHKSDNQYDAGQDKPSVWALLCIPYINIGAQASYSADMIDEINWKTIKQNTGFFQLCTALVID